MAKETTIPEAEYETLLEECQEHFEDADSYLETVREDWDDLEAMLVVSLNDDLSATTRNTVFDPILSTMVYERVSRVMAQNPKGKAFAQSKDDLGKNALMNLLLSYYYKNANEQDSMLIKLRLWDLYSLVYGTMFALVPWRVDKDGYIGPELNILPIRDCFPQPSKRSVNDMDWFIVRNVVSIDWLKSQDQKVWMNIDELEKQMKDDRDPGDAATDDDKRSYVERKYYPGAYGDVAFPQVEIYTEYRKDKWITWTPQRTDSKTSRPFILRVIANPYVDGMLPIVAKHAFPLIDSPIGLGEFARGKSLQMGINSLWNLYLTGVKYSIFPPIHVNPDNVVASSMKWGEGEYWFMQNPNTDVQPMKMSPQGMDTFHSTFGAMKSAIEAQAGTTSVRESAQTRSSLGKTPEAIRFISEKESARDEWDRVMMEEAINDVYTRWIALTVNKMEKEVQMRLFADEIEDIRIAYPDVVEMFQSGKRGAVKVTKDKINDQYDFMLETGSTAKPNIEEEQNNLTVILKAVLENPGIMKALEQKGKQVDVAELFKMWLKAGARKDYDKIIIDMTQPEGEITPEAAMIGPEGVPGPVQGPVPMEQAPVAPQFQDPDIMAAYQQMTGGIPGQPV